MTSSAGEMSRRELLARSAKLAAAGTFALMLPPMLTRSPWVERAAAQTLPNVEANFVALVEAVNTVPDEATARWIIGEFDRALPPLPQGSPSGAVSALLDAYTLQSGHGPSFALADLDGRRAALRAMVHDDQPDVRQIANQVIPFASFAYWSDASLGAPAEPGGERLPQWDHAGWPGPSHGYEGSYTDDSPPGFQAMRNHEP